MTSHWETAQPLDMGSQTPLHKSTAWLLWPGAATEVKEGIDHGAQSADWPQVTVSVFSRWPRGACLRRSFDTL